MGDKIVTRCLVWKTNHGLFYDKLYSNLEWCNSIIEKKLKEINILPIYSKKDLVIEVILNKLPTYYPYVDTMYYIDIENKKLYNSKLESTQYLLRSQSGQLREF